MDAKEQFLSQANEALATMRLLIEGAIALYEDDASPLFSLAKSHHLYKSVRAQDAIGFALYDLRMHICNLQDGFPKT